MKRKGYLVLAGLSLAALLLGACGATNTVTPPTNTEAGHSAVPPTSTTVRTATSRPPTATPKPQPQAFDLVILHTNDVKGYLEPCG
jgi:2',3'-cyclic-nucleotide 2'-phosphodiesterase (5'-nucleotidase family)